ncbi:MAG: hypothetical protein H0X24_05055 [Ktedonobacterales bacterium]|nr:hypothetical protein [Ktedonobacterales bacterium]
MLLTYAHALAYILLRVRGPLMLLAAIVACGAVVAALLARQQQARLCAARPQAKILTFRPRTVMGVQNDEDRHAA